MWIGIRLEQNMKPNKGSANTHAAAAAQWRLIETADKLIIMSRGRIFWQQRKRRRERF